MKIVQYLAIAILVMMAGCTSHTQEPITVGSILILTGEGSSWGIAGRNGIDLAVNDINAQGGLLGREVRVVHEDDKLDPKLAVSAYRKLTQVDKADVIIGTTWTRTGLAIKDLVDKQIVISPSLGVAEFNEHSEYIFNTWPHDFLLSQQLAVYVWEDGHRGVAVFGSQDPWVKDQTDAFIDAFETLGGSIEVLAEPSTTATDVSGDALQIIESDADAVVLTSGVLNVGPMVAQKFVENGYSRPMYSMTLDSDIIAAANGAYDGLVFLTFLTPQERFVRTYENMYGIAPDISADSAYDAVMLWADSVEHVGTTDPVVVADHMNRVREYSGESGVLTSDGEGGFTKQSVVKMIRDGEAITI